MTVPRRSRAGLGIGLAAILCTACAPQAKEPSQLILSASVSKPVIAGQKVRITLSITNNRTKPCLVVWHPGLVSVDRVSKDLKHAPSLIDQVAYRALSPKDLHVLKPKQSVSMVIERVASPSIQKGFHLFVVRLGPLDLRRVSSDVRSRAGSLMRSIDIINELEHSHVSKQFKILVKT